jgi:hypothetical protein
MYPVSTAFKELVRQSHQMILRVEVWQGGDQVAELYPIDGSVEIDGRRTHRRTCELVLAAENGLVPGVNPSVLSPYGNEIAIWRGLRVPGSQQFQKTYAQLAAAFATYTALDAAFVTYTDLGETFLVEFEVDEWVPQGVFLITEVDVDSGSGATLRVRGVDRSLRISRNRWVARYVTEPDDTLDSVLEDLLRSRWPQVETDFDESVITVPRRVLGLDTANDPWKDAQDIALASGFDLFFDQSGVAVLQPAIAYTEMEPQETYLEDSEAMVLSVARGLTSERSYNGAVVTGESSNGRNVYRGEAWDNNPSSPTFRFSAYGQYPQFYSSSAIKSNDQAQAAAAKLVSLSKGLVESFEWVQIVDPSLDAGDYVRVRNTLANVDRAFVIDRLTLPLGPSQPMSCVARTIRIDGRFDEDELTVEDVL